MSYSSLHASAQAAFNPAPSIDEPKRLAVDASKTIPNAAGAIGVMVANEGDLPEQLGLDRSALKAAGFAGAVGEAASIPRANAPVIVAIGGGDRGELSARDARNAGAAFGRAANNLSHLALVLPPDVSESTVQAFVEGVLLARYRYLPLKSASQISPPLERLTLVTGEIPMNRVTKGIERGTLASRAAELARDLANAPATLLTARRMADVAEAVAKASGLEIEVFDEEELSKLGCGGLLGVNAGSAEPPRMIKLSYRPKGAGDKAAAPSGHVALVAKGIMYDSGGISLKPNDLVHATMKGDMSGAAAVLAAMSTLGALGCKTAVTGYLMCTDNMPSGTAMKLGDVLTVRGGTTVEVVNTDAEGRLVMADALVLATELDPKPDVIVDIATLTGACQRALGVLCAGVMGNHQQLIEQVIAAGERTDETAWQLPLERRYRKELDSEIADLKNVGGDNAGAITAALFLEEFVDGSPWAHIDIAGTARSETDDAWRAKGGTGFGARLLIDFLTRFTPPARH